MTFDLDHVLTQRLTNESCTILSATSSGLDKPAPAEMIFVSSGFVRFSFSNPGVSVENKNSELISCFTKN